MEHLENATSAFSSFMWGYPLLILLIGGGIYFLIYSRLVPFRYFRHAIQIAMGKYTNPAEPGQITSFQALSTALSATIGMGNISGVAIAIATGGPGAIFWMWISAIVGMATEFFTCTLAVMYRSKDKNGEIQGGPMYVIVEGLGSKWKPMAFLFCLSGMIGVLPVFQVNQYTQAIRDIVLADFGIAGSFTTNLITAIIIITISALVIFGGIKRIGKVAGSLVPFMTVLYVGAVLYIVFSSPSQIIPGFKLIFSDAFTGNSVLGGTLGSLIILGVKRGTFSSEAGLGTAPMAHGAAKTSEPIRQGLVAMLGPLVDTLIICTMTALALIITGVWRESSNNGVTLTAEAFAIGIPGIGHYILTICITVFSLTTLFAYPYYGAKCFGFVFGQEYARFYNYFYIASILVGALASLSVVMNLIDGVFALMAVPNMIAGILLSPKVREASIRYFEKLKLEQR
ncbi:MAG: alanine/glycine:cation symporter family protein [Cyclobacteriaceae bacterium]|nr:alanine/glycine:cation symporter family protein [Cyclobacteriaceae bacterium]